MNITFLLHILSAFIVLVFGFFVFYKNKQSKVNFSLFTLCFALFIWLFAYSIVVIVRGEKDILFWLKICYLGIVFIPANFYYFIDSVICGIKKREHEFVLFLNWFISILFGVLVIFTNRFIHGFYSYPWGYYAKVSVFLHSLFLVFTSALFTLPIIMLSMEIWNKNNILLPLQKTRLKYIFAGAIFGAVGLVDFLPNYGINIYPFGFIFMVIFPCILAYAILRHQLMDIEVVIKKTLVFAGMFVFSFGVFVAVALVASRLLGGNSIVSLALSALIIIIGIRPIENWLVNSTDKFLFQKKYEYKQVIRAFIDKVATEFNLDEVAGSTLRNFRSVFFNLSSN